MREPPLILVVDDVADNVEILQLRLESQGYEVIAAADGEAALAAIRDQLPDLVLLDIMMPKLDGIATVKALKADSSLPFIPVILVTARADAKDVVAGLEAGADDYLTKPVDQAALMARVRAMLRIKGLHDTVQEQARRLEDQAAELALWNRDLEARVHSQLGELERMGTLKRFLAPQLAELRSESWKAIAATSSSCSATCAGSPPSPRPPSRRRCSTCCASTTRRWDRW
jgi:adenylate cyclase